MADMPDVNEVTGEQWRAWSEHTRRGFAAYWSRNGIFYMACLHCGFPVAYGGAPCDACEAHE